ncbi:MAG: 4-hydroxybenzoate octaprenyltransferase, partial [Thauera phenolivorans]|nr:4-hydroxybenzoate octaprenyltransferase [Thauera phenolivorans]
AVMLCYAATFALLAVVGAMVGLGVAWYLGLLAASVLAGYHYTLIRGRERAPCFKAFRHNNWVGGVIFAGLVLDLLSR